MSLLQKIPKNLLLKYTEKYFSKNNKNPYIVLFLLTVVWFVWWHAKNPSPDGYQNEYLHVGNAFDLWEALVAGDIRLVRWLMYTGYWPFGFYMLAWPTLIFGMSYHSLLATNILLLGLLVLMFYRYKQLRALSLLLLCPGVLGSLLRYEPNFANMVFLAIGIFALQKEGLANRKRALLWGCALGVGLMVDRLTLLFFLVPAALPALYAASRETWKNFALGTGTALLITVAYYREFFLRHMAEIMPQASRGEIDSAGMLENIENPIPQLYYLFSLLDSQAGIWIGGFMVVQLGMVLVLKKSKSEWILIFAFLPALVFFSLLTKKQVFYTLPALVPLALLCSRFRLALPFVLAASFVSFLSSGCGLHSWGTAVFPSSWVSPQHTLIRPPTFEQWPYEKMFATVEGSPKEILVLSQDHQLYEGFLILRVREAFPHAKVRGVVLDPIGSMEFFREIDHFVWMGPAESTWPTVGGIQAELISDHYDITALPDIAKKLAQAQNRYQEKFSQPAGNGVLHLFSRKP